MSSLQNHLEKGGHLKLIPGNIKREIKNVASKNGITVGEAAEFYKIVFGEAWKKIDREFDELIEQ
ncbi:MAG TPA: hypothetical protein VFQ59_02890 [Candidatus Paceibacterota bacterium]|nr:hypothetical protein [Candidatus Paceibacterota bacterium]